MTTQSHTLTRTDMKPAMTNVDRSRNFWNRTARKYAKSKIGDQAGYKRSLERTRDFLSQDMDVVEIGCGTGTTALYHAPHVAHVTGTDISPEMVDIAREKTADSGPLNADFIAAVADDLPFPAGRFDIAMGHNIYHLVEDVDAGLQEAHRVTKTGGLFITKTPCLGEMSWLMRKIVLPVMQQVYGVATLHTFTIDEYKKALERTGFRIETVEFHGTKAGDNRPFIVARK
ncbi:MAG: class I SAM-dependent methyltransferase [Pseudomonadota bacterium]